MNVVFKYKIFYQQLILIRINLL